MPDRRWVARLPITGLSRTPPATARYPHTPVPPARIASRCPGCSEYNTMVEESIDVRRGAVTTTKPRVVLQGVPPKALDDIHAEDYPRMLVPLGEFNRVLGGGIVPGSITLIGGEPGIGKSTLLIQVSTLIAQHIGRVLYVSGEESTSQIKMRAERLGLRSDQLMLVTESNLHTIFDHIKTLKPALVIIDSIQTIYLEEVESSPGSVSQVRECAGRLQMLAKGTGVSVFLIGHVTKEGSIAGPRILEHLVDAVLYLEGDSLGAYRLLRGVKNRFGATNEIGVFEMTGRGMSEVCNPSEAFLAERAVNTPGTAVAITMEGTRPLLVEIQALISPTSFSQPRRTPNGIDYNRMLLISAVLTKRLAMKLSEQDIFINVVGGMKVDEPASDLAAAVAMASSHYNQPAPGDMAFVGEIGLSGELRMASQIGARLHEAAKLGFRRVMIPRMRRAPDDVPPGLKLIQAGNIGEALVMALPKG
ncbi:MAG: DNA repair protein RadA [Blastochloris sp.]|nr:DNA repair protein RadA [Blastochloris sp.]